MCYGGGNKKPPVGAGGTSSDDEIFSSGLLLSAFVDLVEPGIFRYIGAKGWIEYDVGCSIIQVAQ
jgi:hypothetical protein